MRVGDFSVDVVAADGGAREVESGHVLARPGQVYTLRLRNHGPLRAVADISIDGQGITGGGLVLDPWSIVDLERPIHESERGRFTVIAEGNEQVFGPDGGRDNSNLGLIEARFRRELPPGQFEMMRRGSGAPDLPRPIVTRPLAPPPEPGKPWRPGEPRFGSPNWNAGPTRRGGLSDRDTPPLGGTGFLGSPFADDEPEVAGGEPAFSTFDRDAIERAAGTGLTGSSNQEFVPVHVGQLEFEATIIRMRLVIASEEVLAAPRPLPKSDVVPARPAARP